jgi:hypothetical protein
MISIHSPHIRCPHSSTPTVHTAQTAHRTSALCGCDFVHNHATAFIDLGWVVVGMTAALAWLVLLIVTGFNPVAVGLGLIVLLLLPSHL